MKEQILNFIGKNEEYPNMHELYVRFIRVHYDGTPNVNHNTKFLKTLLELIDDGKIFYDGSHDAWGLLKEEDFHPYSPIATEDDKT